MYKAGFLDTFKRNCNNFYFGRKWILEKWNIK